MSRSTRSEQARRINEARSLFLKYGSPTRAADELATRFHISRRQAYRYVEEAQSLSSPVPIPGSKSTFTVKLPSDLIQRIRQRAKSTGQSISDTVAHALELLLKRRSGG